MRIRPVTVVLLVACTACDSTATPAPPTPPVAPAPTLPEPSLRPAPEPSAPEPSAPQPSAPEPILAQPTVPEPTAPDGAPAQPGRVPAPPAVEPLSPPARRSRVTRRARQDGGHGFVVQPAGITFELPWPHTDAIETGAGLRRLRECGYEWDREYVRIANAALPFEALTVHAGSDRFCHPGMATDLHARMYILDEPAERVIHTITARATVEAERVSRYTPPPFRRRGDPPAPSPAEIPGWTRIAVPFSVFYFDYGGSAVVDFYVRRIADHTVVFVFMHAGHRDDDPGDDPIHVALTTARAL